MKPLFLFLFLLIAPLAACAQNAKIDSLRQVIASSRSDSMDGMDAALNVLQEADPHGICNLDYARAGRPLWLLRDKELQELKSAKYSCGGAQHTNKAYPQHRIEV